VDLITSNLMSNFKTEQSLPEDIDQPTLLEHFANYCAVSSEFSDEFALDDIHVAGGNDLGIDGLAVVVNGNLISSIEEIEDLAASNKYIEAEFVFVQAKSASKFDGGEIGDFHFGVRDFFSQNPKLPRNAKIKEKEALKNEVYKNSALFKRGNPTCTMYYVTTGKWTNDPHLEGKFQAGREDLLADGIFGKVVSNPVDAALLQKLYNYAQNKISREIVFQRRTVLPEIPKVREAYIGILPVTEYLKLIEDENGNIIKGLFYDNVRDFQGDNEVNLEISQTIKSGDHESFVLLNNGVTIVAENLKTTADKFLLEDYQVVNGCQTSHVIHNNKLLVGEKMFIPVKIIVSDDDNITNKVIKSTNRQTSVRTEELQALTDYQKRLEEYYKAFDADHRLYYERRSKQFNAMPGIEKVRIITIPSQIRSFSSMFLDRPHTAGRYYASLLEIVKDSIFLDSHDPIGYYVSAFANYKLEALLRSKQIDGKYRPFRYHMLSAFRRIVGGTEMPDIKANKFAKYCEKLKEALWESTACVSAFKKATKAIDASVGSATYDRDTARNASVVAGIKDFYAK
jgi:hypothetical protein